MELKDTINQIDIHMRTVEYLRTQIDQQVQNMKQHVDLVPGLQDKYSQALQESTESSHQSLSDFHNKVADTRCELDVSVYATFHINELINAMEAMVLRYEQIVLPRLRSHKSMIETHILNNPAQIDKNNDDVV